MSFSRPYKTVKFRGLKIITYYDSPMSINNSPMFIDGQYVDNNLDIYDSYIDHYGSSRVRCYNSWEQANSVAKSWNDEHEESEREKIRLKEERKKLEKEKEEQHWKIVEKLKTERKRKIKVFVFKIRNIFKNKRADWPLLFFT